MPDDSHVFRGMIFPDAGMIFLEDMSRKYKMNELIPVGTGKALPRRSDFVDLR